MSRFTLLENVNGHIVEAMTTPGGVVIRDTYASPGSPAALSMVFLPEVWLDVSGPPEIKLTRPGRSQRGP